METCGSTWGDQCPRFVLAMQSDLRGFVVRDHDEFHSDGHANDLDSARLGDGITESICREAATANSFTRIGRSVDFCSFDDQSVFVGVCDFGNRCLGKQL